MTLFLLFFDYCASKQCSKNSIALYLSGPIQVSPKNCVRNWRLSKTSFKRKFDPCGKRNSSHYTVFYPGNFLSLRKSPKYVFRVRIFQITFGAKIQIYLLFKEALLAPLAMLKTEAFCSYFQTLCCFFFKGMLSSAFCLSSLPEKR